MPHPSSTRATSGRASPIPTAPSCGALDAVGARPRSALDRRGRRAAHGFLAALRLRARHRGAPHASRFACRRRRRSPGRSSRRCASAGRAASSCRRRRLVRHRGGARRRLVRRRSPSASPPRSGVLGARHLHGARPRRAARPRLRARRSSTGSTSISTPTRPTTRAPCSLDAHRRGGAAQRLQGPASSSAIAARSRASPTTSARATLDKVARGRHRRRLAADVQPLSAGPPQRRHARRAGAA